MLAILAILTIIVFLKVAGDIRTGKRLIGKLHEIPEIGSDGAPPVSIVIPACNEEQKIEAALASVLAQDYPGLEVIVVNDRSTDNTGGILRRMAASVPALRIVTIDALPAGWLGKNNALHTAAAQALGEWIIFADADVVMHPSAVRRAVEYGVTKQLDHLAIAPRAIVYGFLTNVFLVGFGLMFSMYSRPWRVRDPKAKEFIGIGAFNMVRATSYRAVGGHAPIAMRPDDDLKLGKLLKYQGYRSDFLTGVEMLSVEWYSSFAEMRNGLMKNMFAVLNYNPLQAVLACLAQFLVFVWPVLAIAVLRGPVQWLYVAAFLAMCFALRLNSAIVKSPWWWSFTLPLAGLLTIYLIARASILAIRHKGIDWRGTHYALDELRANNF